jgi:hypothetical protein
MRELGSMIVSTVMTAAIGVTGGAIGGLLYARAQDPPLQVQVLDMRRMVETVASDPTLDANARRVKTQEISDAISTLVGERAAHGVIVIDASAVLRAPPQAYVQP